GRVDAVTAVSPVDRAALSLLEPKTEIAVVHNGIDCDYYREVQPRAERPTLVFTGTMDFRPNVDAMVWFCREIFPLILDEIPDCHLLIVGRDPAAAVLRLVNERVHVSGTTEDVRPF